MTTPTGRIVHVATALFLSLLAAAAAGADRPASVRYLHAQLIDTSGGTVQHDMTILVRGDLIESVLPGATLPSTPATRTVDLHDEFVIPGLINSHVHLATSAVPVTARAYLRRELYSGVTAVRDMAGDVRLLSELKREAEFDEIGSPDIYYAALMAGPRFFDDPRTHEASRGREAGKVPWMQAVQAGSNLPVAVALAKGTGATGIKLYADLPAKLVAEITAEAHRQQMLVWAHADTFPAKPSEVVAAGVDVMSHACLVGYEASDPPVNSYKSKRHVDGAAVTRPNPAIDAVFARMRERGTILDATLSPYEGRNVKTCLPAESDYLARAAHRAGVEISAGTDDDADWRSPDSELDAELELLVDKAGLTPAEALQAATLTGARTVGEQAHIGTLTAGKRADFVVLKANPLEDIRHIRQVDLIVKHGIVYARTAYRPYRPAAAGG